MNDYASACDVTLPSWMPPRRVWDANAQATTDAYAALLARKRELRRGAAFIYALLDPDTEEIRYIGKSIRPRERFTNHLNEHGDSYRHHWFAALKREGKRPLLRHLEMVPRGEDWQAAERAWIAKGRALGWRLVNCTSGGDGVPDLPPESRARITAAWTGRKHRPETLAKLSVASRGRRHSTESRERMRQVMTGRTVTWGDKLRLALCKLTPDQVRAIRAALALGVPHTILAARYGVDKGTISNIKRRVSYAWVE